MTKFYKIAEMLDVELGEVFRLVHVSGNYTITEHGFFRKLKDYDEPAPQVLYELFRGDLKIEKWPDMGDLYWNPDFYEEDGVTHNNWDYSTMDSLIKKRVGCYRTRKEAIDKARELGWIKWKN